MQYITCCYLILGLNSKVNPNTVSLRMLKCSHTGGCVPPVVVWVQQCDRQWALQLNIFFTGVHDAEERWKLLKTEDVRKKSFQACWPIRFSERCMMQTQMREKLISVSGSYLMTFHRSMWIPNLTSWILFSVDDAGTSSWGFHVLLLPTASHCLKTGRLIGDFKLLQGVNCCQSPCDWLPVQGNPRLSPNVSWNWLQSPLTLKDNSE